jgi:hypothetical protein
MNFENDAQRQTYNRVRGYMQQMFGEMAYASPDEPYFQMTWDSALVTVAVLARDDHSIVRVVSYPVTDVAPNFELYTFLLKENAGMFFGAFGIDDSDDIVFAHNLYGDTLDKEELEWAFGAVAGSADHYDDEIVRRYGGLRAPDRMQTN